MTSSVVAVTRDSGVEITDENAKENLPDQGYAWVVVFCSFIVHFFALGVSYIFGVYQQAYSTDPTFEGISVSGIAIIGSLTASGLNLFSIPSGNLSDRYGANVVGSLGGLLFALSFILASFSTRYWQIVVTQGFLAGAGISFSYFPALSILSQWFDKRKGLATGIAVSGSGIGGMIISPVTEMMIKNLGRQNALLITGLVGGFAIIIASLQFKPRYIVAAKPKPDYLSVLKNSRFQLLYLVIFIGSFGYFIPFFYLSSYAVQYGITVANGAVLIGILNGASAVGRIIIGQLSDSIGHINGLVICMVGSTLSLYLIWPFSTSFATLIIFATVFGLSMGGYISTLPSVIAFLFGTDNIGAVLGLVYSAMYFGTIGGPFIASLLVQALTTTTDVGVKVVNYFPMIMFAASCFFVATCFLLFIKFTTAKVNRTTEVA